eukprot:gene9047-1144_t
MFLLRENHILKNKVVEDIALNTLADNPGSKKKRKRIGRGIGSGRTSTRGRKRQKARSSVSVPVGFEGGQSRVYLKVPKYGFKNRRFKLNFEPVSLEKIQYFLDTGRIINNGTITLKTLYDSGCITKLKYPGIKIVANGSEIFKSNIDIEVTRASKEAISIIEKNGGSIRCVYFGKRSFLKLRRMEVYDPEIVRKFSMPPPKLWRYYMRSDIRGYLADNNPINPHRDLVELD